VSEAFEWVALKSGGWSIRGVAEGETFHPAVGPVVESRGLYADQLRLAERAAGNRGAFVVWDIGLGAGCNIAAALSALSEAKHPVSVRVLSFDRTLAPLRLAVERPDALGLPAEVQAGFRDLADHGAARLRFDAAEIDWEAHLGDFPTLARTPRAAEWPAPHAILWDPFSPAKNPAMWTLELFAVVRGLVGDSPCQLATYSRATLIRTALLLAGWCVGRGAATGEKEETTLAATSLDLVANPLDRAWLERVRRSTSAEPLRADAYRQHPLSDDLWENLQRLPQFAT
jgi:tRNA U34 5-methylaminomethyl-2-thiouridine-forming methyltransferase MnmC